MMRYTIELKRGNSIIPLKERRIKCSIYMLGIMDMVKLKGHSHSQWYWFWNYHYLTGYYEYVEDAYSGTSSTSSRLVLKTNLMRMLLLPHFVPWGNWGSKRLSNYSSFTLPPGMSDSKFYVLSIEIPWDGLFQEEVILWKHFDNIWIKIS